MLGKLERQVMEAVWARGGATVMTVMSRLTEKGVLRRELVCSAYVYRPAQSRAEYQACMASRLLREALDVGGDIAINTFVDLVAEHDPEQIAHLDRLLKAKRRALPGERKAG